MSIMPLDSIELLKELIALPGPPGQEDAVRDVVAAHAEALGCRSVTDPRGNLIIAPPGRREVPERVDVLVTAHLDEIAMLVESYDEEGWVKVVPLGGLIPWKCGEGPVSILAPGGALTGILSFGSVHTASKESRAVQAKEKAMSWELARVFTGETGQELEAAGVRPGTRVVLGPERRTVTQFGDYVAAPFLDDRADLVAMLLAIEELAARPHQSSGRTFAFAATAAEEVGGHGALYLMRRMEPDVAIALEIGPRVPESPFPLDGKPTVWVNDAYSSVQAADLDLIAEAAAAARERLPVNGNVRGGSDASCAASHGMVARPITLAFAAENSHGYEITHCDSIANLAKLLITVLDRVVGAK
jgi:putative aminopeptidase FrvX